jgi:CBS domain-containing protein
VLVSGVSFLASYVGNRLGSPYPIIGVFDYLGIINGALVLFNLIPAFPLDGGRVLRSALWNWKKDLPWATFVASRIGVGFSYVLMGWGAWSVYKGNPVGGVWYVLIGLFLRGAANMSYRQVLLRGTFQRESVRKFMRVNPVTAPAEISIDTFVREYAYRHHYKMFPVVDGDRLVGCVRTRDINGVPRDTWATSTVRDITVPVSQDNSVSPESSAAVALAKMSQSGSTRLLVLDNGGLVGVITLRDLLHQLSLRSELEQG